MFLRALLRYTVHRTSSQIPRSLSAHINLSTHSCIYFHSWSVVSSSLPEIRVGVSLQLPLRAHSTKSEQTKTVSTRLVARESAITDADSLFVKYYSQLAIFQSASSNREITLSQKEVSQKEDCVLSLQYIVNCHSLYREAPLRPRRNKAFDTGPFVRSRNAERVSDVRNFCFSFVVVNVSLGPEVLIQLWPEVVSVFIGCTEPRNGNDGRVNMIK